MDDSYIPVCVHTDRSAPLSHPAYLDAIKRGDVRPPVSAYITKAAFKTFTAHITKWAPSPNQENVVKAQRLSRTVGRGCFLRPAFCIMMCELLRAPEGVPDCERRRSYRFAIAELAGCVWDLSYTSCHTCEEHEGDWEAVDDVRMQTHGFFE